jgi:hypothetical protein
MLFRTALVNAFASRASTSWLIVVEVYALITQSIETGEEATSWLGRTLLER